MARAKQEAKQPPARRGRKPKERPADTAGAGPLSDDELTEAVERAMTRPRAAHTTAEAREGSATTMSTSDDKAVADKAPTRSVVNRDRYGYVTHKEVNTPSGRAAVDNNDAVASALRGMTLEQVLDTLTMSGGKISDKWANLNSGMQRMSAGNVIRRLYNAGEVIQLATGGSIVTDKQPAEPKRRVRRATKPAEAEAHSEAA